MTTALQMKVDQLRLAQAGEVDKTDLLPSTTYDVAALWSQLAELSRASPIPT